MSDRLNELQRQRALAQEQLAWLDREIARESGGRTPTPVVPGAPAAVVPPSRAAAPPAALSAEQILAQYQPQGRSAADEAKRGCLVYFIAAMTMLVLAISAFLLLKYK